MKIEDALEQTIKSIEVRRGAIDLQLKTLDQQIETLKILVNLLKKGEDEYNP
jgi:hypothetical protein